MTKRRLNNLSLAFLATTGATLPASAERITKETALIPSVQAESAIDAGRYLITVSG